MGAIKTTLIIIRITIIRLHPTCDPTGQLLAAVLHCTAMVPYIGLSYLLLLIPTLNT